MAPPSAALAALSLLLLVSSSSRGVAAFPAPIASCTSRAHAYLPPSHSHIATSGGRLMSPSSPRRGPTSLFMSKGAASGNRGKSVNSRKKNRTNGTKRRSPPLHTGQSIEELEAILERSWGTAQGTAQSQKGGKGGEDADFALSFGDEDDCDDTARKGGESLQELLLPPARRPDVGAAAWAFDVTASVSVIAPPSGRRTVDASSKVEQTVRETLARVAEGCKTRMSKELALIEMEAELSSKSEHALRRHLFGASASAGARYSERLEEKLSRTRECLQANSNVVERLLLSQPSSLGEATNRPLFAHVEVVQTTAGGAGGNEPNDNDRFAAEDVEISLGSGGTADGQSSTKEAEGYDTALQVVVHTARDWTAGVQSCRDETIGWILRQLREHCCNASPSPSSFANDELHVLVPGAGLGRLAYDISTCVDLPMHVRVEANDSSAIMAIASRSVLGMIASGDVRTQLKIYPFVSDPKTNEVSSHKRFDGELFPDEAAFDALRRYRERTGARLPNLSYNVGDFVATYAQESKRGQYDAIATSFFVDTTTNIYEYVAIMKHLLHSYDSLGKKKRPVWINCGPVQWHPCAWLRPTVDELQDILLASGFELVKWEIAQEAVAYKHPDEMGGAGNGIPRYTRSEGYRPLRFVAELKDEGGDGDASTNGTGAGEDADLPLLSSIQYIEYLHGVVGKS